MSVDIKIILTHSIIKLAVSQQNSN